MDAHPLTARVMGSLFALISAQYMSIALDARWSAIRIILQTLLLALAAIALAIVFSWSSFQVANPFTLGLRRQYVPSPDRDRCALLLL